MESQRDQSGLLQGIQLMMEVRERTCTRGRKKGGFFPLIALGDDALMRYDALVPWKGWSCVAHPRRKHQKAQSSQETARIPQRNYTWKTSSIADRELPPHRQRCSALSHAYAFDRTHARTHTQTRSDLQLLVM